MFFESDNTAPIAPKILKAIENANYKYEKSYGADQLTYKAKELIKKVFEAPEASIYFVSTGTAANAIALSCVCSPWARIFCHEESHIENDECNAPEFFTGGAKITLIKGKDGKISINELLKNFKKFDNSSVHIAQKGVISITNPTECGSVYSIQELKEISEIANYYNVPIHMDGARFANAISYLNETPANLSWRSGVDILSLGGTKNGLMGAEAVILFNKEKSWEFELRRKKSGHLFSKYRYLSAQMHAYFKDNLWLELAEKSNKSAKLLSQSLIKVPHSKLKYNVEANSVFIYLTKKQHENAFKNGAKYYLWPHSKKLIGSEKSLHLSRFVCNWKTSKNDIKKLTESFSLKN